MPKDLLSAADRPRTTSRRLSPSSLRHVLELSGAIIAAGAAAIAILGPFGAPTDVATAASPVPLRLFESSGAETLDRFDTSAGPTAAAPTSQPPADEPPADGFSEARWDVIVAAGYSEPALPAAAAVAAPLVPLASPPPPAAAVVAAASTAPKPEEPRPSPPASPTVDRPTDASSPLRSLGPTEAAFLEAMNLERARAGVFLLAADGALASIAYQRSADMAERGYFAHVSPSGTSWLTLANQAGLRVSAGGENLAKVPGAGLAAATTALSLLMESPTHRANILSARFTAAGVAAVVGADGTTIITTIFAAR